MSVEILVQQSFPFRSFLWEKCIQPTCKKKSDRIGLNSLVLHLDCADSSEPDHLQLVLLPLENPASWKLRWSICHSPPFSVAISGQLQHKPCVSYLQLHIKSKSWHWSSVISETNWLYMQSITQSEAVILLQLWKKLVFIVDGTDGDLWDPFFPLSS